nr:retrovirus-related Pol polyprotein from transposon TNT 1-94 [Tanacetum cinerariifolium]
MKNVLKDNDRLLEQALSVDIVNIVVHAYVNFACMNVDVCERCVTIETEHQKDFINKECYDTLFKKYNTLEKHCISLEVDNQLKKENFQRNNTFSEQSAPTFAELFEINDLKAQSQAKDTIILKLKERLQSLSGDVKEKKTYKQLYDSIKSSRVRSKEQCDDLIKQVNLKSAKVSDLNASLQEKVLAITALKETLNKLKGKAVVTEAVSLHHIDPELLKIDVAPLAPKLRNNRIAHTDYLRHTQEETVTLREIVESERLLNPFNTSLDYACKYTKRIQELLIILQQICPYINDLGTKLMAVTQKNKDKQIRFTEHIPTSGNTPVKTTSSTNLVSNPPVLSSTRVNLLSSASKSQPQGNTKNDRIQRTPRKAKKNKLEDHLRTIRPSLNKKNVVDTKVISSVKNSMSNVNSDLKCATCNGCLFYDNHDSCVVAYINSVNARQTFTLVGIVCPLTRITTTAIVPLRKPIPIVVQIVLWYLDSGCSKHMTGDRSQLINFVQKFLSTVKFGNDHVVKIMGYGDYKIVNVTISRVYFVEGLGYNLFSVGQFCDSDLEVAFRQYTCFIRNLDGVDLFTGSRGKNRYTLSLQDMMVSSPICLLSKASKTKSWLWHRQLSHLNFGVINHLARLGLVRGLLKLKFEKDHLCSVCAMGKSTKKSHKPKTKDTNQEKLYLLHMDLCGPMRVESINGKKYILVIVDDYSRFTWVKFLRSKDEVSDFIIKFLKMIQVRLKVPFRRIQTDNRTKFVNQTLRDYYEEVGISHETSVARSPQQNGVVERRNHTLIEAARTINNWDLLFQPMFDELLNPPPSVDHQAAEVIALTADVIPLVQADSTGSPSSTTVDQDTPSPNKSHTTTKTQSYVIPQEVEEDNMDMEVAHIGNDPWFGVPIPEVTSTQSLLTVSPQLIVQPDHPIPQHNSKWTKDYPLQNIIKLSRTVSTWLQLHEQALFYYYDAFLTSLEPKTYKEALTQSCWIEAMQEELNEFERLEMSMMGKISFFLGLQISQSPRGIFINQSKYALESLKKYGFESCDTVDTPMVEKSKLDEDKEGKAVDLPYYRGMIGTLLYLTASRPDLQFAICMCARYQARPIEKYVHTVKRIFRYLRGTINRGLWYPKDSSIALTTFVDADHAGCQDTRRNYGLGFNKIPMYCDNKSAIALCCNNVQHARSKHIDIRYHFIKEQVENGVIELYFINTEYQLANLFTKALGRDRIEFFINKLGMRSFTPENLKQLMDEVDE